MIRKLAFVALVTVTACRSKVDPADWVFRSGAVYTVDADRSWAEAVAVRGPRIVYVGGDDGAAAFVGPETEVVDLDGKMVLPGFFDSHTHPAYAPVDSVAVRLYGLDSLEDYVEAVRRFAAANPDREAIRGAGWSNTLFPETGPSRAALDAVVSDRPVFLESEDGHSAWVNSKALALAGITKDTHDPEGGVIERDSETGEPSGTLRESATDLVDDLLPPPSVEDYVLALEAFQKMAAEQGVTSVRDAYVLLDDTTTEAYTETNLTVRYRANLRFDPETSLDELPAYLAERDKHQAPRFTIDGIKIFVDGVVEGETAYLLEPYAHRPDYRGELLWEPEHLNEVVAALDAEGFMVHMHAIGDGAVRVALHAFEHARNVNGPRDSRHQITHLQLVHPDDIARFRELGVIGVPQPFWFMKDYYEPLELPFLGEARASHEYPMRSFFDAGVTMASASDFPVTIPFSPLDGIERGVLRTDDVDDPKRLLGPEERVSLEDMIESFTINGAYASFLEKQTGSLEVGKLADLVVLEHNLFDLPPEEISETKVLLAMLEGEPVFRAGER